MKTPFSILSCTSFPLLQGLFLVFGMSVTGILLAYSYLDWGNFPIITTIESITRPVSKLQFPTVTVCPDQQQLPRPWSYVEKLLGDNYPGETLESGDCPKMDQDASNQANCKRGKLKKW